MGTSTGSFAGDHRHYGVREEPYRFVSLARLIDDFLADVQRLTGG